MALVLRSIAVTVVLLAPAASLHAQNPACRDVRFSAEVLSRFPGAPASCLDVIDRDGQQYAVFKAQLEEVRGDSVRVRVKNPDGTRGELKTIQTKPGRQVLIDGRRYPLSELAPDQEITAYIRVDRPLIALEPSSESDPIDAYPLIDPESQSRPVSLSAAASPVMPRTASSIAPVALLGQGCIAMGLVLMAIRKGRGNRLGHNSK